VDSTVHRHHIILKIASEIRNVGNVAYAMSHAAAEAFTQRLAAGRGHGYRLAAPSLSPSAALAVVQPAECE